MKISKKRFSYKKQPYLQILHFNSITRRKWVLPGSSRDIPAPGRKQVARRNICESTRRQGCRPLAPGEPLTLGKTLHSAVPNPGSGYSSSLPELNKQPSFKRLTYALFFLEKKTHNNSRGFT